MRVSAKKKKFLKKSRHNSVESTIFFVRFILPFPFPIPIAMQSSVLFYSVEFFSLQIIMLNYLEPYTHLQLYDRTGYFNSILSSSFLSAVDPSCKSTDLKIVCQLEEGRKFYPRISSLFLFANNSLLQVSMFHWRPRPPSSAASQTSSSSW